MSKHVFIFCVIFIFCSSQAYCMELSDEEKCKLFIEGYKNAVNFKIDKISFETKKDDFLKSYKKITEIFDYSESQKKVGFKMFKVEKVSTSDYVVVSFLNEDINKILVAFSFGNIEKNLGGVVVFTGKLIDKFGVFTSQNSENNVFKKIYDYHSVNDNFNRIATIIVSMDDSMCYLIIENTTISKIIIDEISKNVDIGF